MTKKRHASRCVYMRREEYDILLQIAIDAGYKRVLPYIFDRIGIGNDRKSRNWWIKANRQALRRGDKPIFLEADKEGL
jgi:hypothetical protein